MAACQSRPLRVLLQSGCWSPNFTLVMQSFATSHMTVFRGTGQDDCLYIIDYLALKFIMPCWDCGHGLNQTERFFSSPKGHFPTMPTRPVSRPESTVAVLPHIPVHERINETKLQNLTHTTRALQYLNAAHFFKVLAVRSVASFCSQGFSYA